MTNENQDGKNPLCNGEGFATHPDGRYSHCNCIVCVRRLMQAYIRDAQVPPRYWDVSLASLQPENQAQRQAIVKLKEYVASWGERRKLGDGIALLGPGSRSGKTHAACAVMRDIGERYLVRYGIEKRGYRIPLFFLSASSFIGSWRRYYARPRPPEDQDDSVRWREYSVLQRTQEFAMTAPLLIIDDLGEVSGTEFSGGMLYELVEHRVGALLPIIITSNLNWEELKRRYGDAGARIVGRLQEVCAEFTILL